MNPYGVAATPRYDPAALAAWTAEVEAARREYRAHTTTPCRKCSRTAEPGITVCQSCRMSAVRGGKKKKRKK